MQQKNFTQDSKRQSTNSFLGELFFTFLHLRIMINVLLSYISIRLRACMVKKGETFSVL